MTRFGTVPSTEIADITGALGIGALNMLALFLALDATTDVFAVVETHAETASWAIFVALPVLVASYVMGVIMIVFGGVIRTWTRHRAHIPIGASLIAHPEIQDHLANEYRQFAKKRDVLEGSVPTAAVSGAAIWMEAQAFGYQALGAGLCALAGVCAIAGLAFAAVLERDFREMLDDLPGMPG